MFPSIIIVAMSTFLLLVEIRCTYFYNFIVTGLCHQICIHKGNGKRGTFRRWSSRPTEEIGRMGNPLGGCPPIHKTNNRRILRHKCTVNSRSDITNNEVCTLKSGHMKHPHRKTVVSLTNYSGSKMKLYSKRQRDFRRRFLQMLGWFFLHNQISNRNNSVTLFAGCNTWDSLTDKELTLDHLY